MTRYDDELAALLALDALPAEEQADAELRLGTFPLGYGPVTEALADGQATDAPAELRAATMSRALTRRAPGRPVDGAQPCRPLEAYLRTAEDLRALLDSLRADEWTAQAHAEHGSVHNLMAHLVGVELLSVRWLTEDDVPPLPDHVASTRPVVDSLADAEGAEVTRQWYSATREVAAAAAQTDPRRVFGFHDMHATVSGFLIIRTFELWAHAMDITAATGRPLLRLDDERMAALSSRLMAALPMALTFRRRTAPGRTMRFVLTGPAGGTYTVPLHPGEQPGEPDAVVVADATQLCLVAAQRLAPDALPATVDGDRELAAAVLAGIDGFARD